jgi:hypothetical protein
MPVWSSAIAIILSPDAELVFVAKRDGGLSDVNRETGRFIARHQYSIPVKAAARNTLLGSDYHFVPLF